MDTREISDAHVNVEPTMNGNTVEERAMPDQDNLQLKWSPLALVHDGGGCSSGTSSSVMLRLLQVEGLRAYLALWVLVSHALWASGYQTEALAGLPKLIGLGGMRSICLSSSAAS